MNVKGTNENAVKYVLNDILSVKSLIQITKEVSEEKYPDFLNNQDQINGFYRKSILNILHIVDFRIVTLLHQITSTSSNEINSLKSTMNYLDSSKKTPENCPKSSSILSSMKNIQQHLNPKKNIQVKRIATTRNNLTAHSYNLNGLQSGGASKPSDFDDINNVLIQWAIRLIAYCTLNKISCEWSLNSFSAEIMRSEISAETLMEHIFSFNKSSRLKDTSKPVNLITKDSSWDT